MATDLGKRLLAEGAGVYYDGPDRGMRDASLFGLKNQTIVDLCSPRVNIPKTSLRYFMLPKELRNAVFHPDTKGQEMMKGIELMFFQYRLDMKQYFHTTSRSPVHVNTLSEEFMRIFGNEQKVSSIYTNFMGEAIYVGNETLMQEVTDYLKGGFPNFLELAKQLVPERLAQYEFNHNNKLHVFDSLTKPKYVCNKK